MRFLLIAAIALLAAGSGSSVPAGAVGIQAAGSQITVNTCLPHKGKHAHLRRYVDAFGNWQTRMDPARASTLEIHYVNTAKTAAKEIDFGLSARNVLVAQVKDVGTFSTGIAIDHDFLIPRSVFPLRTGLPQCPVLKVVYADGSSWVNPNPPQP